CVIDAVVAPVSALATLAAPVPELPPTTTTFSDCSDPLIAGVDVTVMFDSAVGATAVQISAVPNCALERAASRHVKPPPVTVTVCFDDRLAGAPGETNATSRSPADNTLNGAVVRIPAPSEKSLLSMASGCDEAPGDNTRQNELSV